MDEILEFEKHKVEYKSLKKVFGKNVDLKDLAKTCVCSYKRRKTYETIS